VQKPSAYSGRNRLLAHLPQPDFGLLEPHLVPTDLPVRKQLESPNQPITAAYFPENGIASVVANGHVGRGVEIGLIGCEGVTGVALVMGVDRAVHDTYMQVPGAGLSITSEDLKRCSAASEPLRRALLQYAHAFSIQVSHTAMINARSKIEDRLARWLLMAHDRMEGDQLNLTHEFIATMLGVRRPGVTVAMNLLQKDGLIRAHRGVIEIIDREGLEKNSNGAYGAPEAELRRLLD